MRWCKWLTVFTIILAFLSAGPLSQPGGAALAADSQPWEKSAAVQSQKDWDKGGQDMATTGQVRHGTGDPYPVMRPSQETLKEWTQIAAGFPHMEVSPMDKLRMDLLLRSRTMSLSLLDHIDYVPEERDQGRCGNCWVWAGTGAMETALSVQNGIKDRLSIQYFNSNFNLDGHWAGCGGYTHWFTGFYAVTGMAVPWSNTNAHWQDGDSSCSSGTAVPAEMIATEPHYTIMSIEPRTVPTHDTGEAQAIAGIKTALHQGKAVLFSYYMPEWEHWLDFSDFWVTEPETTVWSPDYSTGYAWADGAGHQVLCVGYHDGPGMENDYWIMLNSWGTTSARPNGLFMVDMHMDYGGRFRFVDDDWSYSFHWEVIEVTFADYVFADPWRGTGLHINIQAGTFRLTTPAGYDSGTIKANHIWIREIAGDMSIVINHRDARFQASITALGGARDFASAYITDRLQRQTIRLLDPYGRE